jgi:hypothetical protein
MSVESDRWIRRAAAWLDPLEGDCRELLFPEITVEGAR